MEGEEGTRLVAAVIALLHVYAQQATLAVDVAIHLGALRDARGGRVTLEVRDERVFASLREEVAVALRTLPALRTREPGTRSNVGITLLGERAALALADLDHSHDLHFIFHQQPSGLALLVSYDYGRFRERSIEAWLDAFTSLLDHACT